MIERVARALAGHYGPAFDDCPKDKPTLRDRVMSGENLDVDHATQEDHLDAARAAVEAMRRPSREMCWALLDELRRMNDTGSKSQRTKVPCICKMNVPDLYMSMIDAALAEDKDDD